jgi:predicted MFS family arabinose efflux permease
VVPAASIGYDGRPSAIDRTRMNPVIGLAALAFAYLLSQFYRSAIAVIARLMAQDLGLDQALLGALSSAWFIAFAAMQIPDGVLLDRYGPRRTVASLMTVAVIGSVVFATATTQSMAIAGQALIGIGCSPIFMGTLHAVSHWFARERFASLSSLVLAFATVGILLSARPFGQLVEWIGWRAAYLIVAAVTALALLAVALLARGPQGDVTDRTAADSWHSAIGGVGEVLRIRALWLLLPLNFAGYASLITVRGLWGGPYLSDVFGLSLRDVGNWLFAFTLAMVAGTLAYGWLEQRWRRRKLLVQIGSWGIVAGLAVLALWPSTSLEITALGFGLIAFSGSTYVLLMAQAKQHLPDRLTGRGLASMNFVNFAGAGIIQAATGAVAQITLDSGADAAVSYGVLFGFMALLLAAVTIVHCFSRSA